MNLVLNVVPLHGGACLLYSGARHFQSAGASCHEQPSDNRGQRDDAYVARSALFQSGRCSPREAMLAV